MHVEITGSTAGEIARSVRDLVDTGAFPPEHPLPPVRALAERLGVNRNTVVAAYRQLSHAGVVVTRGRAGTSVAAPSAVPDEGFARSAGLGRTSPRRAGQSDTDPGGIGPGETVPCDVASGNPDPALLPVPSSAVTASALLGEPVLYGQATIDAGLAAWATEWMRPDCPSPEHLAVTAGAVDAIERLLALHVGPRDAVALEDPCFLTSIHTVQLGGYRTLPVAVDTEGMTVEGLRAALAAGARAVVCTPRAHNPTGASLSAARAAQLREVLAAHPYVLVIVDDHFSMLACTPYRSIVPADHRRWALVRSVSKFLGPDLRVAVVAFDAETSARFAQRIRPGTMWISHTLQRLAHGLLTDPRALEVIERARAGYAQANAAFVDELAAHGVDARAQDGLNVWVDTGLPADAFDGAGTPGDPDTPGAAGAVGRHLVRRGWLARAGDEFTLTDRSSARGHLRLTVHALDDDARGRLAVDMAAAIELAATPE